MTRWAYVMVLLLCISTAQARGGELGTTLHNATVMDWGMSTDDAALDAANDYIIGSTDPAALGRVGKRDLQQAATAVAACMRAFSDAAQPPVTREDATPHIMHCMTTAKAAHSWMLSKPLVLAAPAAASASANSDVTPWDMSKAQPVPYAVVQAQKDHRATTGRTKLLLRIVPVAKGKDGKLLPMHNQNKLTKEQLAATVVAAAKYHAQATSAHMVGVALQTQYFPNHGAARLAIVDYAPDGKGVSGKDDWRWNMFSAAASGPTDAELKAEKPGTLYLSLEKAPAELADAVEGSAPLK